MTKKTTLTDIAEQHRRISEMQTYLAGLVHQATVEGTSWSEIGEALGISKQTAHARYAKQVPAPAPSKIPDAKVPATVATSDDPIHQGITDTAGTPIDWTGRRQLNNPKQCPFCEQKSHLSRRGPWWIYPDCTLTADDYTAHDGITK